MGRLSRPRPGILERSALEPGVCMSLYLPSPFEQNDPAALRALMHAHPLATWVGVVDGQPLIQHLPLLFDPSRGPHGTLMGHVARANPVWQQAPRANVFVFHGPQAYVTPSWYPSKREHGKVVPTWNYAVVHAQGEPRFIHEAQALRGLVDRLTQRHEQDRAQPWSVDDAPAEYTQSMLKAIVGVEVEITAIQGKFKLSQNRSPADREGVRAGASTGSGAEQAMASLMAPDGSPPRPLTADHCPLCGQPNRCAASACGTFDVNCWCMQTRIPEAVLARVPDGWKGRACLCPRCASGATPS